MKGAHRIIVENNRIKYDFEVKRNITFITGDSATGKTVLIDLIREYKRYGKDSGVNVSCDCPCVTVDDDWESKILNTHSSIIFIDEGNKFIVTEEFAKVVQKSDNYFVVASREKLPMLPYSVDEIYGFRKSGRYTEAKKKYNEIYHLYGETISAEGIAPSIVVTEDSNAGYEFYSQLAKEKGVECITANGKSNIVDVLKELGSTHQSILAVADGAAYGSEMKDTYEYFKINNNGALYAPESFEWLLLSLGVIPNCDVKQVLDSPENYIESSEYISWERYFTDLLTCNTSNDRVWRYSKSKLNNIYISSRVKEAAKKFMKLIKW
jgi:hypothetical protein